MNKTPENIEAHLLSVIRHFLLDSGAQRAARAVAMEASLERDLGIGSLEKAELFHRIEKTFDIRLPDALMVDAKQVKDLLTAIVAAEPKAGVIHQSAVALLAEKQTNPSGAKTLTEVLQLYADQEPDRPHMYLQNELGEETIIRYGDLYKMASQTAQGLIQRGLKPGDTVAIMLPTSADFFYAFFGTLLAGGVPVPIYPPFRADQIEAYAKREALILRNAGVRFLITFQRAEALSKLLKGFIPSLIEVTMVSALRAEKVDLPEIAITSSNPALIQYTSGSTGNPKGVLLTHGNLIANMRAYGKAIQIQPTDASVSWLPLYHDMGLIGSWLGSLYYGVPLTLLSPLAFLSRPERWLWAIHYHRGTLSAGPNFAYELCIKKIEDADIEGLDLSSWRLAFNGAEMIYPKTIENFTKRFARYGFGDKVFFPVYGLAESSLALAFPSLGREPRIDRIARDVFETTHRAVPAQPNEKNTQFVGCGHAVADHEIRVVDDAGLPVPERTVGNIQFRGPSAMQGYYQNPAATQAIYHDGWWESGDLGYLAEGDIFITGRKKDLIVKAGRNYYPAEIEEVVGQVPGVRKGCVAVFGVDDAERGTEKLIVVAETQLSDEKLLMPMRAAIVETVTAQIGIPPDHVILVSPQTIPKTSSGKLRRSSCKQDYLAGKLGHRGPSVATQMTKLFFQSQWKKIKRGLGVAYKFLFSLYAMMIVVLTALPTWALIMMVSQKVAAKLFRTWSRWIFRLCFCPMTIEGRENLKVAPAMIYVANHASYLDALILIAVLPANCRFVAKKELARAPVINSFIKKLKYLTVDRLDFSKSESETQRIKQVVTEGDSLVIFPEGTFTYATGIRLFKAGAFKTAVETQTAICPIAIVGSRKMLRGGSLLMQPTAIHVTILEPIKPTGNDWDEVVRLRDSARKEIAQQAGEQMIDLVIAGIPSE